MMTQLVLISGRTLTGKTSLAKTLQSRFGFYVLRTADLIRSSPFAKDQPLDRLSLQALGDTLDKETSYEWLVSAIREAIDQNFVNDTSVVVDSIRNAKQLEAIRRSLHVNIVHVHLYTSTKDLNERFEKKIAKQEKETARNFNEADLLKHGDDVEEFKRDADVRIFTSRTDAADVATRVAARLGLLSSPDLRCVDVLVGGQYGSEGKGHVAAYLARDYDILIRVGGPNAGHSVSSASGVYVYHQLPSGAKDTKAKLLLGPGMTINVEKLLIEIDECKITSDRLFIDPQAMIISKEDIDSEAMIVAKIGSTGSGSGAASARRIRDRRPGAVKLAKDIPALSQYVGDKHPYRGSTRAALEAAYVAGHSILLEGTQGSGLSLYHGIYPFVTSRDTNVAGCLMEAGIAPARLRKTLMVIRPTPIRVGDPDGGDETSGPLKHATTFKEVATTAGLDPIEIQELEKTSTTKRNRRVGWFDWERFRIACELNAPTDIVLTFADYLAAENRNARRFEQLGEDTIKFIEEIERVSNAPVSLINTRFPRTADRFDLRTIIDRRSWPVKSKK